MALEQFSWFQESFSGSTEGQSARTATLVPNCMLETQKPIKIMDSGWSLGLMWLGEEWENKCSAVLFRGRNAYLLSRRSQELTTSALIANSLSDQRISTVRKKISALPNNRQLFRGRVLGFHADTVRHSWTQSAKRPVPTAAA